MRLIHYGASEYDPDKFKPVRNRNWIKPYGGLWSSPVKTRYGWKEWCIEEEFRIDVDHLDKLFEFSIDGNIIHIHKYSDLEQLTWTEDSVITGNYVLDFESMVESGIDAIHLTEQGQEKTRLGFGYASPLETKNLYGWDCECVLVLNKEIITPEAGVVAKLKY